MRKKAGYGMNLMRNGIPMGAQVCITAVATMLFVLRNALQGMGYAWITLLGGVCELIARACIVGFLAVPFCETLLARCEDKRKLKRLVLIFQCGMCYIVVVYGRERLL